MFMSLWSSPNEIVRMCAVLGIEGSNSPISKNIQSLSTRYELMCNPQNLEKAS